MTAPLEALFDEMAATLANVVAAEFPDLNFQTSGLRIFACSPPTLDMFPGDPFREDDDTASFGDVGGAELITVRARVTIADVAAGQRLLLRLMDDYDDISVAAALMDDQTLNGFASSVAVDGNTGHQLWGGTEGGDDGGPVLGTAWRVRVMRVAS